VNETANEWKSFIHLVGQFPKQQVFKISSEAWVLKKRGEQRLEGTQMKFYDTY
jgi:hypothetical protein